MPITVTRWSSFAYGRRKKEKKKKRKKEKADPSIRLHPRGSRKQDLNGCLEYYSSKEMKTKRVV